MERRKMLINSALAMVGATLASPATLLAKNSPPPGPRADYFPNFTLYTHEGKPVRFYEDLICGRLVMLNMFYATCDGICPGMTSNLVQVQKMLGKRVGRDIFMYSISLKPAEDTPKVLKAYARSYKAGPGWLFLTGKPAEIEVLRQKLGFTDPNPSVDADKSQHTGMIRIGNERFDRWSMCPALAEPDQIVNTVLWLDLPHKKATKG